LTRLTLGVLHAIVSERLTSSQLHINMRNLHIPTVHIHTVHMMNTYCIRTYCTYTSYTYTAHIALCRYPYTQFEQVELYQYQFLLEFTPGMHTMIFSARVFLETSSHYKNIIFINYLPSIS